MCLSLEYRVLLIAVKVIFICGKQAICVVVLFGIIPSVIHFYNLFPSIFLSASLAVGSVFAPLAVYWLEGVSSLSSFPPTLFSFLHRVILRAIPLSPY